MGILSLTDVDSSVKSSLSGLMIDGKEVPVYYADPEKEFVKEEYPFFALTRAGAYPDEQRWDNDPLTYNYVYDTNGNVKQFTERPNPIPYNVFYMVRLYYDYNLDGVVMNTHIMKLWSRGSYVTIGDDQYDVIFVSYKNPNSTYREFGKFKENDPKQYIDQYLYKLEINLETGTEVTVLTTQQPATVSSQQIP